MAEYFNYSAYGFGCICIYYINSNCLTINQENIMGLNLYPVCHRGRNDCEPIHCIPSEPEGITEEQYMNFDYDPPSFVCCGCNKARNIDQDIYRLCFKNEETDEMSDNDLQDLTSIVAVVGAALNADAVRKVNSGIVEIPAEQRKIPRKGDSNAYKNTS